MTEGGTDASLPYSGEIWRKALHLLSLSIPVGLLILGKSIALYILVPLTSAFVLSEILRSRSAAVRDLIFRCFGFMMRSEEIPPVPAPLRFNGATWVLLGACATILLFNPQVAAAALVVSLIGDAAAALVGRQIGKRPIGRRGKTLEGSLAFVLAAFGSAAFVPGHSLPALAASTVVGALVEGIGTPINDNITVPLAAGLALALL